MGIKAAKEEARCQWCINNLTQCGLALQNFNDANDSFPPACIKDENDKPLHSWQSLVKPYIGYYSWRRTYDIREPWDGPNNAKLHTLQDYGFQCPSVDMNKTERVTVDYVAVVGPDTMWPGVDRVKLPEGGGNRDTILLIEMPGSDYTAFEPRSPTVDEFMEKIKSPTGKGIRCIHSKGLAYVTVGGDVRWFPPDTDPEAIRHLLKRDPSCKVISPNEKIKIIEHWKQGENEGK